MTVTAVRRRLPCNFWNYESRYCHRQTAEAENRIALATNQEGAAQSGRRDFQGISYLHQIELGRPFIGLSSAAAP